MDSAGKDAEAMGGAMLECIRTSLDGHVRFAPPASKVQIQEAERLLSILFPPELAGLLRHYNGIEELMLVGHEETAIGWILYPLNEMIENTQFHQTQYQKRGIFFADDGAGDPFYITESGEVRYFHPIADEDEPFASSLNEFYQRTYPMHTLNPAITKKRF